MNKLEQSARQACQTPLKDLLRSVPKDGRDCYEESSTSHHFIPYGRLIHEALAEIERLEALAEQAEQEPVAWILMKADGTMDFDCQPNIKPTQNDYDVLREGETFTPLYAAPVRTKDLTDDDLLGIWFGTDGLIEGLRAVIAADREKNRG